MSLIKRNGNNGLFNTGIFFPRNTLLNEFFDSDFPIATWSSEPNSEFIPAANIKEREKEFTLELSVPGYTKKDIHVEVDANNTLRITGQREEREKEEKENYTRREFSRGSFERTFQLPETVNENKIQAKCKDGVLTVDLHKKEAALLKNKTKEIQIA